MCERERIDVSNSTRCVYQDRSTLFVDYIIAIVIIIILRLAVRSASLFPRSFIAKIFIYFFLSFFLVLRRYEKARGNESKLLFEK